MKKIIRIKNLDCANCGRKIEDGIKKIDGVNDASVSFMTQKIIVDFIDDEKERIMAEIVRIARKVEPDLEFDL